MSFAESWKSLGNQAYQQGKFELSIEHFTKAIEADPENAIYYLNRSLSYASLKNWELSLRDAAESIQLDGKYTKGHFRYVKALLELERYPDARTALLRAIRECGEKDLRILEDLIFDKTGIPLRPKSTDFEIICELGDGNFSKIYKTYLKKNHKVFAIKTIEKQTVERMKRRHPNIHNEILMEKRVLQKLNHPGIVTIFATFQDFGTLYYQMEYIAGRDLWFNLHEILPQNECKRRAFDEESEKQPIIINETGEEESSAARGRTGSQIGLHWSLVRFYFAEIINAVEHMHRHGIVHRDIKPENIMICANGHLKFVDFGTAKDMIQTDLNGQEFVGTPEYMSPDTVCVKNGGPPADLCADASQMFSSDTTEIKKTVSARSDGGIGIEADMWALGILLYQMVLGGTPFQAPSPYLIFLRIKRGLLFMPNWLPWPISSLIRCFLVNDPKSRMMGLIGQSIESSITDQSVYASITYDIVRNHPFFLKWDEVIVENQIEHYRLSLGAQKHNSLLWNNGAITHETCVDQNIFFGPAVRIPSLHDLCIRAVAHAAVDVSFATADNGGIRPKIPWMQKFNVLKLLSPLDLGRVAHVLDRQQKFHIPGVQRLFFHSLPDCRCRKANDATKEYSGFSRILQGHFTTKFHFVEVSGLSLAHTDTDLDQFKAFLSHINKIRPKFLAIIGNFLAESIVSDTVTDHDNAIEKFRKQVARVSDTISVVFVPGVSEVGVHPTQQTLTRYRALFGADYFSFWYQGMKGIVINSPLLLNGEGAPEEADTQIKWLEEEIEQAKLCASTIVLFSYHPWYYHDLEEDDYDSQHNIKAVPKSIRMYWLKKLKHSKVKLVFSAGFHPVKPLPAFPNRDLRDESSPPCDDEPVEIGESDNESFENIDDCQGPQVIGTYPRSENFIPYQLLLVGEDNIQCKLIADGSIPTSMQEALQLFSK